MAVSWTVIFAAAVCLTCAATGYAQSVVDDDVCERYGTHCPRKSDPSYKTYCCVEKNGGTTLYSCCNPYFGLYIGIGVGVPVIIAIVVVVLVTYCLCVRHHNRKMRALVAAYNARRQREQEERNAESNLTTPPRYSRLDGQQEEDDVPGRDPELPRYTEEDPYGTQSAPNGEGEGEAEGEEREAMQEGETEREEGGADNVSDEGDVQVSDATPLIAGQS